MKKLKKKLGGYEIMKIKDFQHAKNPRFLSMKKVILFLVLLIFITGCAEKQLEKPNIEQPETDVQKEQPIAQPEKEVVVEEIIKEPEKEEKDLFNRIIDFLKRLFGK